MPERTGPGLPEWEEASRFAVPTLEEWRAEAVAALKGGEWERKLVTRLSEGIELRSLYTEADTAGLPFVDSFPGGSPFVRGTRALGHRLDPWEIAQELPFPLPDEFRSALVAELAHGQTAAVLLLDLAGRQGLDPDVADIGEVGRGGTSIATVADIDLALSGIDLERVPVFLAAGSSALPATALLVALARRRGCDLARLRGTIGSDPLADAVAAGIPVDVERQYDDLAVLTSWAREQAPLVRTLSAWGGRWHDAGANPVEELAWTLASAAETLRAMDARGIPPARAAGRFFLGLAVGPRFLVELAKFRAARMLWARLLDACGCPAEAASLFLHARTASNNLSAIDAPTNILRTTTEALAAILAGVDGLTVLPYDLPLGLPSERSRRLARNTQLILREESKFDQLIDAAGGSFAIEALTGELAAKAWELFREVEAGGGLRRLLEIGQPQATVLAEAEARRQAIVHRREVLVGVNQYPSPGEPAPVLSVPDFEAVHARRTVTLRRHRATTGPDTIREPLRHLGALTARIRAAAAADRPPVPGDEAEILEAAVAAALRGATLGEISTCLHGAPGAAAPAPGTPAAAPGTPPDPGPRAIRVAPLPVRRLSDEFESLRSEVRALRAARRVRQAAGPEIFLANLGPPLEYLPRLEFTRSFFALAGFETAGDGNHPDALAAAEAALASGSPVACLVSTDARYRDGALAFAAKLKRSRPDLAVLVAGLPAEPEVVASWRRAGVDEFIHLRSDAHAILAGLARRLGGQS